MKGTELPDPLSYIIKITLVKSYYDRQTVYYRYEVPPMLYGKWKWYFEYLAAKIKVRYPKATVEYYAEQIGVKDPWLAGDYYKRKKTETLTRHKLSQIKRLEKERTKDDDLFHFKSEDAKKRIEKLKEEVKALEKGEYAFYIPETYINRIKETLR